jgi:hypothetical protein
MVVSSKVCFQQKVASQLSSLTLWVIRIIVYSQHVAQIMQEIPPLIRPEYQYSYVGRGLLWILVRM